MTVNLLDLNLLQLADFLNSLGEKPFRARQLLRWMHQFGVTDFTQMTDLSKALRAKLARSARIAPPQLLAEQRSADGTRKWLFEAGAANAIETVFIPEGDYLERSTGSVLPKSDAGSSTEAPGRYRGTLCISSQVGCALACTFCATGRQGFNRNLNVAEIIGQLWWVNKALTGDAEPVRAITNVVMMGMGEPLANFENVCTAMDIMLDDFGYGLSRRRVTLSTSGVVPALERLRERCPVALAVSLHAPNDSLRNVLVPINQKYPLARLLAACRSYLDAAPRDFITFEYVMLEGVNDSVAQARELVDLVRDLPCKFNLIPFNPFPNSGYRGSSAGAIGRFRAVLRQAGFVVTTRKTRGDDIDAACGQLAGRVIDRRQRVPAVAGEVLS